VANPLAGVSRCSPGHHPPASTAGSARGVAGGWWPGEGLVYDGPDGPAAPQLSSLR